MTEPSSNPLYTVYLLHFTDREGDASHYVGITTADRLDDRMREHASGRGSRRTAALLARTGAFHLTRLIKTYNQAVEQVWISLGPRVARHCPLCRGKPPLRSYTATKRALGLLPALSSTKLLTALHTTNNELSSSSQKRSGACAAAPLPLRVPL